MISPYNAIESELSEADQWQWLLPLLAESRQLINGNAHGDLPRWREALAKLPETSGQWRLEQGLPVLGADEDDAKTLTETLMQFHPWRKGPLKVGGVLIDTEWRSDWKWQRLASNIDIKGHRVLDIGCGNGYYGWRMLGAGARSVIGMDPTMVFVLQWLACLHFSGPAANVVLPLGVEALPDEAGGFDSVFSMGVLYHRRDPVAHLRRLKQLIKPGGQVILETLVLEGSADRVLVPEARYARMRNVWSLPTVPVLQRWLREAGLTDTSVLDVTYTGLDEQRTTPWMHFESLRESLDPDNPGLTIEGHQAPLRAAIVAKPA